MRDGTPVAGLSPLILQVLLYLATHRDGVTAERLDDAVWAGRLAPPGSRALRLCDPCEPLYIQWAHLEADRGRRDQIPRLWRQLRARYAAEADETAGWVATPTHETELAFGTLMSDA